MIGQRFAFLLILTFLLWAPAAVADEPWSLAILGGGGSYSDQGSAPLSRMETFYPLRPQYLSFGEPLRSAVLSDLYQQPTWQFHQAHGRLELESFFENSRVFSVVLGISHSESAAHCRSQCLDLSQNLALQEYIAQTNAGQDTTEIRNLLLSLKLFEPDPGEALFSSTGVYAGLNIHLNGKGPWDPYIGLDAGIGACHSSHCTGYREGAAKLGIRYRFQNSLFVVLQTEYHLRGPLSRRAENPLDNQRLGVYLFGFGWQM